MSTRKTWHQFCFRDDPSEKLEAPATKPRASKRTILTGAWRAGIQSKAVNESDKRFTPRLDRLQRQPQRIETTLNITAEVIDPLAHHQLAIVAHQPLFDQETGQLGSKRHRAIMDQVGCKIPSNRGKARSIVSQR